MKQRFSKRTNWDITESEFARAIREARAAGRQLSDLTISNPTVCGFTYDASTVIEPLRDTAALTYDPDPRGIAAARESVAAYYAGHNNKISPDDVLLTTSTSEGYGYLLKLLCDAGDEILVPQPSYPLFDYLADLEDVVLRKYPLFHDFGWWIDFAELERSIGPRTRAIVVVHPNNPTGHTTTRGERERLEDLCARHGLALIVDEVFLDYPLQQEVKIESFTSGLQPVLTFVLSGLSKVAALPQMKVGWIVTLGPSSSREEAKNRLEVIADTFLSMSMPVQLALPAWLRGRYAMQEQIVERLSRNLATVRDSGLNVLKTEAGWSAIVLLAGMDRGSVAEMEVLDKAGVIVHPGRFYGLPAAGHIVVSLLVPPEVMEQGASALQGFEVHRLAQYE